MTRIIKRASLNTEEQKDYDLLSDRLGISNESDLIKKAIRLSNRYLEFIEQLVPQDVIQCKLDKLRYSEAAKKTRFKI